MKPTGVSIWAGRIGVGLAVLVMALLLGAPNGGVAAAAELTGPAQATISAGTGTPPPVLADWDDHHCDGDRDHDDWTCRFYRQHHQCDGDRDRDDWFCGWGR